MPALRQVIMVGKKRRFGEERWKQLLTALASVLHERRPVRKATSANGDPDSGLGVVL